jgi:addiction module RelE/StbE family toxin
VNVVLTDAAIDDLDSLRSFIAVDNPAAAKQTVARLFESIEALLKLPGMGRPGRVPATRELVVAPYIIVYTVDEERLIVLRIIHGARNWP